MRKEIGSLVVCRMPVYSLLAFSMVLLALPWASSETLAQRAAAANKETAKKQVSARGFALVEIFTSEVSPSYEAANRLASLISERASSRDEDVYVLSYHVDYLRDVLWTDPYALKTASDRQLEYASEFRLGRARADMAVVNGRYYSPVQSFASVNSKMRRELDSPSGVQLQVKSSYLDEARSVRLDFKVSGLGKKRRSFFYFRSVLVDDAIARFITSGPNKGYTGSARATVLGIESVRFRPKSGKGTVELALPRRFEGGNAHFICFVEDPQDRRVLAATKVSLPEEAFLPFR